MSFKSWKVALNSDIYLIFSDNKILLEFSRKQKSLNFYLLQIFAAIINL